MSQHGEDIGNYTANLNGILSLLAAEVQKFVMNYKTLIANVHELLSSLRNIDKHKMETIMTLTAEFTHQWNVVLPLIEELKRLVGDEFKDSSLDKLNELSSLVGKMEVFYSSTLFDIVVLSTDTLPSSFTTDMKNIEQVFPVTTLKLLTMIKLNVSSHLQNLSQVPPPHIILEKQEKIGNIIEVKGVISNAPSGSRSNSPIALSPSESKVPPKVPSKILPNLPPKVPPKPHSLTGVSIKGPRDINHKPDIRTKVAFFETRIMEQKSPVPIQKRRPDTVVNDVVSREGSKKDLRPVDDIVEKTPASQHKEVEMDRKKEVSKIHESLDEALAKVAISPPKVILYKKSSDKLNIGKDEQLPTTCGLEKDDEEELEPNNEAVVNISQVESAIEDRMSPMAQISQALKSLEILNPELIDATAPTAPSTAETDLQVQSNKKSFREIPGDSLDREERKKKSILPEGYIPPTIEEDRAFLASLSPATCPELILYAVNGYQLLPSASPSRPYIRLKLDRPARIGRSNSSKHDNFIATTMSQVVSRNHLDIWYSKPTETADGQFWIRDIGSNSGTWLNGYRLSEPGVASVDISVKTGDFLRIGADFKNGASNVSADEVRDIRHKCIIVRLLCRNTHISEPDLSETVPMAKTEIIQNNFYTFQENTFSQDSNQMIKEETKRKSLLNLSPELEPLMFEGFMPSNGRRTVTAGSLSNLLDEGKKPSLNKTKSIDLSRARALMSKISSPKSPPIPIFTSGKQKESRGGMHTKYVSRYFLVFSANTLPYRIKKLSIHNPSNYLDFVGQPGNPSPNTGQVLDLIGPEIMQVSLKNWSNNTKDTKRKIVIHDLRIPNVPQPPTPNIGTTVEIIPDEDDSFQYKVILLTGQVNSISRRVAIHMGTINTSSSLKSTLQLCFSPLKHYESDGDILKPGPATVSSSTPLANASIIERRIEGAPPVYKVKFSGSSETKFPSISLVGDFGTDLSPATKLNPSLISQSGIDTGDTPFSPSDETFDKNKLLAVLKSPPPSRIQKLLGEIRGKQILKRSVRETKWVTGLELLEDGLWDEIKTLDGTDWVDYCAKFVVDDDLSCVKWVYRKEWWSLVMLASIIFGFIKQG